MTKAIEAAATADQQRELLLEAFDALHPYPGPEHYLKGGIDEIDWTWDRLRQRFLAMLDAEAYESAALTLVPEGWLTRLVSFAKGNEPNPVYWRCNFRTWTRDEQGDVQTRHVVGVAPTPALAIVIAAIRTKESN